jgi:hypothetical protein
MNANADAALANGSNGVSIAADASDNDVGSPGAENTIAFNGADGVAVQAGIGNQISTNSIYANNDLGIDLIGSNGVDANDLGDGDSGANNLQNYPVLTSATTDAASTITIAGSLHSAASTNYRLEFFASAAADPSNFGEGETYLGTTGVTTDTGGDATFSVPLAATVPAGAFITATATDPAGNTSEFCQALTATLVATHQISGVVFEDVDFAGTATNWDGGSSDVAQPNVDVELYDNSDVYQTSVTTDAGGNYTFGGLTDGTYKVRVRSATLGDADTPPAGGFNPTVPGTWPYPLAEMTWGHTLAMVGGQVPDVDDTDTADNTGPGDTYVTVTISGGDVTGVNLGFCYDLIVNEDDDANADSVRSKQGSLRQFIKNSNAIAGVNRSQFQIPGL